MKTILTYAMPVIVSFFVSAMTFGQSSKSCGSCHKPVSSSAKVGDYCPHCGVRWGYENTSTRYVNSHTSSNYTNTSGIAIVNANSNLRAYASKSAYVVTVIPRYSMVTVIGRYGDWYHVEYGGSSFYNKERGYVHRSLIQSY
jgi:predicted RNA-binding Zn-ribbon protein involved in translation (DUF1610 family)